MAFITQCTSQTLTLPEDRSSLEALASWPKGSAESYGAGPFRQRAPHGINALDLAENALRSLTPTDPPHYFVCAQAVPWRAMPTNAVALHSRMGYPSHTTSFDVNASCLSFLTATSLLSPLLRESPHKTAIVVSSDLATPGLNWDTPQSSALFGDGAAAALIKGSLAPHEIGLRIEGVLLDTHSELEESCHINGGGNGHTLDEPDYGKFIMSGKNLYKATALRMPDFIQRLEEQSGTKMSDFDWVVPHQASGAALELMSRRLNIPADRMVNIFNSHGNQVSASMPTALAHLLATQLITPGQKILLLGTGAGLIIGGAWLSVVQGVL